MHHTISALANVSIDVVDADTGELLHHQEQHNLVVDAGLDVLCSFLAGEAPATVTHFAVGTGTTAVLGAQTTLTTEVEREAITVATTASKTVTIKYYLSSATANGNTLAEIGLFNDATTGDMFARALLTPTIAKTSSIAVTFTWQITFAAA